MAALPRKLPKSAATLRRRMNLWAPLRYSGIVVTHISPDFTHCATCPTRAT